MGKTDICSSLNPAVCKAASYRDLKAIAIFTSLSSKGSGNIGSEGPKEVLVEGANENQLPEGWEVSTWRMLSFERNNQQNQQFSMLIVTSW